MFTIVHALFWLAAAVRWGDWKNYKKYLATIWFLIAVNGLCSLVYHDYWLWKFLPDFLVPNHSFNEFIFMIVIYPCTMLVYLGNLPNTVPRQLIFSLLFSVIYIAAEWLNVTLGFFVYAHSWNIYWSLILNYLMFVALLVHYRSPLLAYAACVFAIALFSLRFPVPLQFIK